MAKNPLPPVDDDDLLEPSAEELAEARRLAEALDAVERGALDRLPNVEADDPLPELVALSHALRPAELEPARREALWRDLEGRLQRAAAAAHVERPRRRWWAILVGGPLAAVALALLVVLVGRALVPQVPPLPVVQAPAAPEAVARLEAEVPQYARRLMLPDVDEPRGDTALRGLREARFEAWRTDTTWQTRFGGAGGSR